MKFRDLKAEEIECRVQSVKDNGLVLLLYKDARVDMNILDETVGAENWQRAHYECKGNLFCQVGIKCAETAPNNAIIPVDKTPRDREIIKMREEWIWKSDCGVESNTEAEKGNASDARKRSGFAWGIGRELYTSPVIKIKPQDLSALKEYGGKWKCFDTFAVQKIIIENKRIVALAIKNTKTGKTCFIWQDKKWEAEQRVKQNA